jgi:uncharacterized Zn-finger protein
MFRQLVACFRRPVNYMTVIHWTLNILLWENTQILKNYFSGISQNPGNIKFNQCEECGLYFLVKRLLHSHLKVAHPEKYNFNFTCYVCGKKFKSKGKLNGHMAIHMFVKPHSCPYCKKQFSDSSNLKTHMHIHTGKYIIESSLHCIS